MFSKCNMDFCMGEVISEGLNSNAKKVQINYSLTRNMFSNYNMDFCMGEVTSEGLNCNVQKVKSNQLLFDKKYVNQVKYAVLYS